MTMTTAVDGVFIPVICGQPREHYSSYCIYAGSLHVSIIVVSVTNPSSVTIAETPLGGYIP